MSLNKSKGNMYPWVTDTWNPIKGRCPHACTYCFYQQDPRYRDKIGPLRLDGKALKDNLGEGRTIFVGSSTDMWHFDIPLSWLEHVLVQCWRYRNTTYLFQSKNPARFQYMALPPKSIIGTTIETNRPTEMFSKAPAPVERASMLYNRTPEMLTRERMVSIEPIMDFDIHTMIEWLQLWIKPKFISIGADSKGHNLPEPPSGKIKELIQELEKFTEVKVKANLKRILQS